MTFVVVTVGPTIGLRAAEGRVLASAGIHGHGSVSWERSLFRDDLAVAAPAALQLFLAEHGVPDQLATFLAPLADLLHLHERRPPVPASRRCRQAIPD